MIAVIVKFIFAISLVGFTADYASCWAGEEDRFYSVSDDAFDPVEIQESPKELVVKKNILRAPKSHVDGKSENLYLDPPRPKAQITYKPKKHEFTTIEIVGKLRRPRLKMSQPPLPLERVDDPLAKDFLNNAVSTEEIANY